MAARIKILEIELCLPLEDLAGMDGYASMHALIRWHGIPVGYIDAPISNGACTASALRAAINHAHGHNLRQTMIRQRMDEPIDKNPSLEMAGVRPDSSVAGTADDPLVTVVVCTRDRTQQLQECLRSLSKLTYGNIDLLVVDNAPSTDETKHLVQTSFPDIRYVAEPRPGLDWARNRAIEEAHGEIIAYTDDDVIVDPLWVDAMMKLFQDDPGIMAVTGLVAPYELETRAQILFERYGGFGRGFKRRWYRVDNVNRKQQPLHIGAGQFGTGANMAFRCTVFEQTGGFDPALDVGTVTNGGGDLEMFFRILEEGHTLVYEPAAMVWHRHRKSFDELRVQLTNHGIGFYSYLLRSARAYPRRRWSIFKLGLWWFWRWNILRLLKSFIVTPAVPRELMVAELRGSLIGLSRYPKAKRRAKEIEIGYAAEHPASLRRNQQSSRSIEMTNT